MGASTKSRLDEADLRQARLAGFKALSDSAHDLLSSASRLERDKLLGASLLAFIVVTTPRLAGTVKAPMIDVLIGSQYLKLGLLLIVAYYLASFALLARSDWLRWSSRLVPSVVVLMDWSDRTAESVTGAAMELRALSATAQAKLAESTAKWGVLQSQWLELMQRMSGCVPDSQEWREISDEMDENRKLMRDLNDLYDLRSEVADAALAARSIAEARDVREGLYKALKSLKTLRQWHLWLSIVVTLFVGVGALAAGMVTFRSS